MGKKVLFHGVAPELSDIIWDHIRPFGSIDYAVRDPEGEAELAFDFELKSGRELRQRIVDADVHIVVVTSFDAVAIASMILMTRFKSDPRTRPTVIFVVTGEVEHVKAENGLRRHLIIFGMYPQMPNEIKMCSLTEGMKIAELVADTVRGIENNETHVSFTTAATAKLYTKEAE